MKLVAPWVWPVAATTGVSWVQSCPAAHTNELQPAGVSLADGDPLVPAPVPMAAILVAAPLNAATVIEPSHGFLPRVAVTLAAVTPRGGVGLPHLGGCPHVELDRVRECPRQTATGHAGDRLGRGRRAVGLDGRTPAVRLPPAVVSAGETIVAAAVFWSADTEVSKVGTTERQPVMTGVTVIEAVATFGVGLAVVGH